jgi:hypothetical protein
VFFVTGGCDQSHGARLFPDSSDERFIDAQLPATNCSDVIGVYEPLVEVIGAVPWKIARAAEPGLAPAAGVERYHAACNESSRER